MSKSRRSMRAGRAVAAPIVEPPLPMPARWRLCRRALSRRRRQRRSRRPWRRRREVQEKAARCRERLVEVARQLRQTQDQRRRNQLCDRGELRRRQERRDRVQRQGDRSDQGRAQTRISISSSRSLARKSMSEYVTLQTEFARKQFEAASTQSKELAALARKVADETVAADQGACLQGVQGRGLTR